MATSPFPTNRDTDADWRQIGASEPFWGVLTHPEFKAENLDAAAIKAFYATGVDYVAYVAWELAMLSGGTPFHVARALDFGCGVGRLTEAMTAHADAVTGYDISPGMLETARSKSGGKPVYTDRLPDGPFDWLNSYIVFQHMPPEQGYVLLDQLLERLAPGGFVSLHFTFYRDAHLKPPQAPPAPLLNRVFGRAPAPAEPPPGSLMMYDYDLTRLCEALNRAGVGRMTLAHTDHGGHHGAHIFGAKDG